MLIIRAYEFFLFLKKKKEKKKEHPIIIIMEHRQIGLLLLISYAKAVIHVFQFQTGSE